MRRLAGVAGHPVGHSRSPAMFAAAFAQLGLDWLYVRVPLPPERFAETVAALPASGFAGLNVTIPHKRPAHALADTRSPAAQATGAANALTFGADGIEADNFDAPGLLAAMGEAPRGRALVLGAGGAARAAAWALREGGADEVAVWNRTPERARELAKDLGIRAVDRPEAAEIVINATSVGLAGEDEKAALEALGLAGSQPPPVFVDLVYGGRPTALERWARRGEARVVGGLEVLVRQGALAFERWTGAPAPVDAMRRAVQAEPGRMDSSH